MEPEQQSHQPKNNPAHHGSFMSEEASVAEIMNTSGVQFGTSGARGLVSDMTDQVCYSYTAAFLQHLGETASEEFDSVAVGYDLRESSPRIALAAIAAIEDRGFRPVNCGPLPSPALALFGIQNEIPTVMITGSHIPADRNGMKFTTPRGEITKDDESGLKSQIVKVPEGVFGPDGMFTEIRTAPQVESSPLSIYRDRFLEVFPEPFLAGKRIGVYEHSAVARDFMGDLLEDFGAEVVRLGRSETFVPVDTEAVRTEDKELAREWARTKNLDAIVSFDGDSDRPLIADENGRWIRGDVAGILAAHYLGADAVALPVSCNTALEGSGWFQKSYRTKIGSPYVIAGMERAAADGYQKIVSYEANGGFLQHSNLEINGKLLAPLPTRDAIILHLSILATAVEKGCKLSELSEELPSRFTESDRLKEFPTQRSKEILSRLTSAVHSRDFGEIDNAFSGRYGAVRSIDLTDGLRIHFSENDTVVHLRPSGNAPEFRCYVEADTEERSALILSEVLALMEGWRNG